MTLIRHRPNVLALGGPALLLGGSLVPPLRPLIAIVVLVGWAIFRLRGSRAAVGWAAAIPVALVLSWPWLLGADRPLGEAGCAEAFSTIAVRRVAVALGVLAAVTVLARAHASTRVELGLRRVGRFEVALAVGGLVVLALGGLFVGPLVAEPFFGRLAFARPIGAIVPAVLFGVANGTLEEVAYRGVLQGWLGRITGPWPAIVLQAVVFGIVHVGPEVTALVPVHAALLAAVGLLAGLVVRRTGSLAIPIGIHIGADIALYVGLACRATT